jgi:hypothetical protein
VRRNSRLAVGLNAGVDARLFDASGRQVRLASPADDAGFDLRGISPGTYFIVAGDGAALECRKVVIE